MGNIQVLKDALAWAKNNPDEHNQAKYDVGGDIAEFEYILYWGTDVVFKSTDATIAKVKAQGARDLLKAINPNDKVRFVKREVKPVETEIDF